MPEYLGYQGRGNQVNWTEQFGALAEQVSGIEARREAEKQELDEMNKLDMTQFQMGENQSMNSFVLSGADNIRSKMMEWNKALKSGQLSPKEYKQRMNNAKEYWGELASTAQSFDERFMKQMERQQSGISSGMEVYGLGKLADFQNIESKSVYVDDVTGRILLSNVDEEGRYVGEPIDINHINNPGNIVDNKVDLNSEVSDKVKSWDVFQQMELLKRGSTNWIEDVRANPQFNQAVNELSMTILSTPNAVASVLSDNGVAGKYKVGDVEFPVNVEFFMDEAEKEAKIQEQIERVKYLNDGVDADINEDALRSEIEKYMIEVRRDANGTMVPMVTDEQKKIARERIKSEVEIQLGHKEKKTPQYKPTTSRSSGGGGVKTSTEKPLIVFDSVNTAWGKKGDDTAFGQFKSALQYNWVGNAVHIKPKNYNDLDEDLKSLFGGADSTFVADTPEKLAQFISSSTPSSAMAEYSTGASLWDQGQRPYYTTRQGQSNTNSNDPLGLGI